MDLRCSQSGSKRPGPRIGTPHEVRPTRTFSRQECGDVRSGLAELLDKNVRYPETVEKSLGVRVLGVVPESGSLRRIRPGHVDVA